MSSNDTSIPRIGERLQASEKSRVACSSLPSNEGVRDIFVGKNRHMHATGSAVTTAASITAHAWHLSVARSVRQLANQDHLLS